MPRYTEQDKREILLGNGLNPDEYTLTDDGYAEKIIKAQPGITNTPTAPLTTKYEPLDVAPQSDTPWQTAVKSAERSALPALLGGAGTGLGLMAAGALGATGVGIPAALAIGGGLLGAYGGEKIQEDVSPEGLAEMQALAESQAANPKAAFAGNLATMPLAGFGGIGPSGIQSIKNIGLTGRALPRLLGLTSGAATPIEKAAALNVGIGTGLGGALPVAHSLAVNGELPPLRDVLTGAAANLAFNEPNVLGRKLFGFHPTMASVPKVLPDETDVAMLNPQPTVELNPPEGSTILPKDELMFNTTGQTYVPGKKGSVKLVPGKTTLSEVGPAEDSALAILKAKEEGQAEIRRQDLYEVSQETLQKQIDYQKAVNEVRAEQIRMAKQQLEELRNPKAVEPKALEPQPEQFIDRELPQVTELESFTDLQHRKTEARLSGENPADVRYSSESETRQKAPIGTEFTGRTVAKLQEIGVNPNPTASWKGYWKNFLEWKRNITVKDDGKVVNDATGKEVAGKTYRNEVGKLVNEISSTDAGLDTHAHEGIHGFIDSIRGTKMYQRFEQLVSESPEFADINARRVAAKAEPWTPEEYIATEQGYEFLNRNLKLRGETEFKTWWRDFVSDIKVKYGKKGTATNEDFRRLLQYKFQYDKATGPEPTFKGAPIQRNQDESEAVQQWRRNNNRTATGEYAQEYNLPDGVQYGDLNTSTFTKDTKAIDSMYNKLVELNPELKTINIDGEYNGVFSAKADVVRGVASKFKVDNIKYFVEDLQGSLHNKPDAKVVQDHIVRNQDESQLKQKPANEDWQVTVQPEHPEIPGTGYVQIDDITGGQNRWSKGKESLTKEGYDVPDFSKLPGGKYKYEDALKMLPKHSDRSELKDEPSLYLTAPRIVEKLGTASGEQWAGTLKNKINPFEMDLLKHAGIDEFLATGKKTDKEVATWIRENGPRVKIESYGMEGKVSEAKKEYDKMTHEWYDTLSQQDRGATESAILDNVEPRLSTPEQTAKAQQYLKMRNTVNAEPRDTSPRATSAYSHVSAFSADEPMPEWTATKSGKNVQRVDVVVTQKTLVKKGEASPYNESNLGSKHIAERDIKEQIKWQPDNLHENLPNTLGWAMIQYKTGPKGEKIAVIAEAQSRWGQADRQVRSNKAEEIKQNPEKRAEIEAYYKKNEDEQSHPLLRDYNRLILKAAIAQARKEGADHIMVSDAETAMMTEGHDLQSGNLATFATFEEASNYANEVNADRVIQQGRGWAVQSNKLAQEPGMRLNYDTILPKIAEELTGSKGEKVSLGEHKNSYEQGYAPHGDIDLNQEAAWQIIDRDSGETVGQARTRQEALVDMHRMEYPENYEVKQNEKVANRGKLRSNLIFKNADGTPKTDVSGHMYDISNVPEKYSMTAKRYSEGSELLGDGDSFMDKFNKNENDPGMKKLDKVADNAFNNAIELDSNYDNPIAANNEMDVSRKADDLATDLFDGNFERNSEKSEMQSYKASFAPFLTARFDKIAENIKTPTARMVTDNLNNFAQEQDILTGQIGNKLIATGKEYSDKEQQRVYRYAHQMSVDGDSAMQLTGREKNLFQARLKVIQDARKIQNDLGLKVKSGEEFRLGGIDPKGYMFSVINPEVAYTWAENANSVKSKAYDTAYVKHMTDHGMSGKEALEALVEYKGALGSNTPRDIEFGALRKAAGLGLPWELVDQNFNSAAMRYARRAAKDLAYFKWIQNDPKMLKALNRRDQFGNLPDQSVADGIENIQPNEATQQAMRSVDGVSDATINPRTMAWARSAVNTVLGPGTAIRNIVNMPSFIATYVQLDQLPLVFKAFAHMNESRVRAFENNAVRASFADYDAAGYYLGNPNPTIRLLNKYSEAMRKYQGRNLSDTFEGEYYYSLGELLATSNIAEAKAGNKESKMFVKKFASTVEGGAEGLLKRKVTQDDINRMAKSLVDHARGSYGPTGLPSFAIEGQIAPFFSLNRFAIEKANTVYKDVILPAKQGIYGPLVRYVLGSAGVGFAIEELNALLSNKRGNEPTINELLASGDESDLLPKAISTMQLASFAGIVSDGAQLVSNAARGKGFSYNNPISFPLYTLVTDTLGRNIADAATAIKEGEDPFEVLAKLSVVLSTQSVQGMRYLDAHVLHPEEAKRKEKFRDYNLWQEMTGRKEPDSPMISNQFKNMASKEYKRETDPQEAVKMLPDLIRRTIEKSKNNEGRIDPVKLGKNFTGLKLNSYQVMPALENDPVAFTEYYEHIRKSQGEAKAKSLMIEFMRQREVNKVKNSLIPSF